MQPGELKARIAFLEAGQAINGLGETVAQWQARGGAWAKLVWIADGERWRAGAVEARAEARVTCRASAAPEGFGPAWRLRHGGRDWAITALKPLADPAWVEITAWRVPA